MNKTTTFHPDVRITALFESDPRRGRGLRLEVLSSAASGREPALHVVSTGFGCPRSAIVDARWRQALRQAVERWCELCDAHEHGSTAEVK